MKAADKVADWIRWYDIQLSFEAQLRAIVHLKVLRNAGDSAAGQALEQCLREFLK